MTRAKKKAQAKAAILLVVGLAVWLEELAKRFPQEGPKPK